MSTAIVTAILTTETHRHEDYIEGEKLGDQITELCGNLYAATYRLLVLIHEFDEQGYWQLPGLCSCAHWLNFKCGIGMNAAREKVRVAHALAELPKISKAFERGELSYSKARAMTRIADKNNEDYLLMIARHGTWKNWSPNTAVPGGCRTPRRRMNSTHLGNSAISTMTTALWYSMPDCRRSRAP